MTNIKILLVEDNLLLAKSTAKLIENLSEHRVQLTDQPQTLFELCTAGEIDIVLMDINLPEANWLGAKVSGVDLARLLKENKETAHIPIIILTAYVMEIERESILADSKANGFLSKPIRNYIVLIEMIEKLVNK